MARALFLLIVFSTTFAWPYLNFSCNNSLQQDDTIFFEVNLDDEKLATWISDLQDENESDAGSTGSTPTLLEDFIHESMPIFFLSSQEIGLFHPSSKLLKGIKVKLLLPPRA